MPEIQLPLLRGDKNTDLDYRDLLPVNMMPVIRDIKGDSGYLLTVDGLEEHAQTGGKARGGYYNERFRKHFRVSGDQLQEISIDGTVTNIGLIPGTGECRFASSFNTQAILADGRLFYYDNATLREVIDPDLGFPIDITWFRGVYVLTDGSTVYQSDITDEFSFSPLKFVTSEFSNDDTVAVRQTENNQVMAFNRTSIEFFFFNPNVDPNVSVLNAVQGKSLRVGAVSASAIAEVEGSYFCIGSRPDESFRCFMVGVGGQEQPVSTRHIEQILEEKTLAQLARAYVESVYKDKQHYFILHLDDCTLVYNHTIGRKTGIDSAWSMLSTGVEGEIYRAKYGVFDPRVNEWIFADIKENKLGKLVSDSAKQYDEDVECLMYTPQFKLESASIDKLEIDTIPGFGESQIDTFISTSVDGVSFSQERRKLFNKPRGYGARYIARRFGYVNDHYMFKIRTVGGEKSAFSTFRVFYG